MMKKSALLLCILLLLFPVSAGPVWSGTPEKDGSEKKISMLAILVPAEQLEYSASLQYAQIKKEAADRRALAADSHPQLQRLRFILGRMLPNASAFNSRSGHWKWEVNLIGSDQLNAFCMPGGKIAFYSGIINKLDLTDDEIAIVMSHEIAHALREHARTRISKMLLAGGLIAIGAQIAAGKKYGKAAQAGMQLGALLLSLKFSRKDETEADLVGLELAARGGFDPRAGVTLWKKMAALRKGSAPQWLSTHPAENSRIHEIERHLPEVMPLYTSAKK
jgi:predicted Zn-dependent protease